MIMEEIITKKARSYRLVLANGGTTCLVSLFVKVPT